MNLPLTIVLSTFFGLLGACVGSFLNVVVWRLPHRGQNVTFAGKTGLLTLNWPPSHCPNCHEAVAWYQNLPVLAWLLLHGRCARCKVPIAIRYPLVELGTGVLFLGLFLAYFVGGWPHAGWFTLPEARGIDVLANGGQWAAFVLQLFLVASLLAASAIDADWYIIPLGIPALIVVIALVAAPLIPHPALPTIDPRGPLALPTIGGAVGLGLANLLLWRRWIPQSFGQTDAPPAEPGEPKDDPAITPLPVLTKKWPSMLASVVIILVVVGAWALGKPAAASLVTVGAGIVLFLIGVLPRDAGSVDVTDEVLEEIDVPKARLEISKELLFVAFPILGAIVAATFPMQLPAFPWLGRLLGVMLGFLAGGGIVWFVRIGGTLGFGKEAMGLGDVHLMAAVGAVLGAPLAILAFFLAPFLGLVWAAILIFMRRPNLLPYGPWLSVASIVAMVVGDRIVAHFLGG